MPKLSAREIGTRQTESLVEISRRCGVADSLLVFVVIWKVSWNGIPERVIVPYLLTKRCVSIWSRAHRILRLNWEASTSNLKYVVSPIAKSTVMER